MPEPFLHRNKSYRDLIAYKKAECIYDITFYFAHKHLSCGDRTVDQMVQAARSGKQNIAEGNEAAATSKETEIKLTNVARASLHELLIDYEDYLRVRHLEQWTPQSEKFQKTREICSRNSDSEYYRKAIEIRSDETIANIAIIMIRQTDFLLNRYIDHLQKRFLEQGGFKETMYKARKDYRGY